MSREDMKDIEIRKKVIKRLKQDIEEIRKELGGTGKPEGILKIKGEYVSSIDEIEDMYQAGDISERTRYKYLDKLEKILNNEEIEFIEKLIEDIERSIKYTQKYIEK